MPSDIATWSTKDWLEAGAYAVAIIGALAGAAIFLTQSRSSAIEETRKLLAREWTNEGDISSEETRYVTLQIENHDGDLIGSLESPSLEQPLEVHVDVGWRSSMVHISELRGRSVVPIAIAQVKVTGNKNRLTWALVSVSRPSYLPSRTVLWPAGEPPKK